MDPNAGNSNTTQPTGQEPTSTETSPTNTNNDKSTNNNFKTPEWYEAKLKEVRDEAASWRTKYQEAKKTPTPEELAKRIEDLEAARAKAERDALVATIGRDLPDDLLEELRESSAKTEEELKAKAEKFRKYAQAMSGKESNDSKQTPPPGKLAGGLNPGGGSGEEAFDAAAVVRDVRARRG